MMVKAGRNQRIVKVALATALLAGLHYAVLAQSTTPQIPNAGDAVQQAVPPTALDPKNKADDLSQPRLNIEEPEMPVPVPGSETLFVKSIHLDGASEDEQDALQPLLAQYLNKELTIAEMNNVARAVTRYYRNHGFLVARAYVPKQSSLAGALTITIVRGFYGAIDVKNNSRLRLRVVQNVFQRMKTDSPSVTQHSLERAMTLIKEMPGGTLPNVSIKPGNLAGATDLNVKLDEVRRFHGYLQGDNQGSQFTGRKRVYAGLDISSPLGIGDLLSIAGVTTEKAGLKNGSVSYGLPLNDNGFRFMASYTRTLYTLGGIYTVLGGTGAANTLQGIFSYPVLRRREESIDFLVSGAHKKLHDDLSASDTHNPRNANLGTATLQRSKFGTILGRNSYTTLTASVTAGQLEVLDRTQRKLGGIDGTYGKLNFRYTSELLLAKNVSSRTSLSTQKDVSNKGLDSSEQLFISSSGGVRAYAESASGDNGYVLTQEFRYLAPKIKVLPMQQALVGFFDNGALSAQKNGTSATNFALTDAGAGYSANFHSFFANAQVARSLGALKQHNETHHTHVWAQIGYVF